MGRFQLNAIISESHGWERTARCKTDKEKDEDDDARHLAHFFGVVNEPKIRKTMPHNR